MCNIFFHLFKYFFRKLNLPRLIWLSLDPTNFHLITWDTKCHTHTKLEINTWKKRRKRWDKARMKKKLNLLCQFTLVLAKPRNTVREYVYVYHAAVAVVCASSEAVPHVTGVGKAAAGDDPSSPINGGPRPPSFSSWPHVTPSCLATHAASVPTANERLNIHAERFHLSCIATNIDPVYRCVTCGQFSSFCPSSWTTTG